MQITPHFSLNEVTFSSIAGRRGIDNSLPDKLMANVRVQAAGMEFVRHLLGDIPLHVDSWYRCPALNDLVGGAAQSDHLEAFATDFICPQFGTPLDIARKIIDSDLKFGKLILEWTWVHLSFDPASGGVVLTSHLNSSGHVYYTNGLDPD